MFFIPNHLVERGRIFQLEIEMENKILYSHALELSGEILLYQKIREEILLLEKELKLAKGLLNEWGKTLYG